LEIIIRYFYWEVRWSGAQ